MTNVHLETRPTPRIPTPRGPSPAQASPYPAPTTSKASWWLGAVIAIVAISAVAVLVINQNDAQTTAAFKQGGAQATATDATRTAQQAAIQANNAADAANASAIRAENQNALIAQRNEDNPPAQSQAPTAPQTAAAPGVTSGPSQ